MSSGFVKPPESTPTDENMFHNVPRKLSSTSTTTITATATTTGATIATTYNPLPTPLPATKPSYLHRLISKKIG